MPGAEDDLATRITRIEDRQAIEQLPIRYALAVDQRDVAAWTEVFVPDINMGRHGIGREALRDFIVPQFKWFYRSIHQIVGHRVELLGSDTARGSVYCRAEHEVGDRWIVMAIRYDDEYRKVDGEWYFSRRQERHWYAADLNEHPQSVEFDSWGTSPSKPKLPILEKSWSAFWNESDTTSITSHPAH